MKVELVPYDEVPLSNNVQDLSSGMVTASSYISCPDSASVGARNRLFPNSAPTSTNGWQIVGQVSYRKQLVCERCRIAESDWLKQNRAPGTPNPSSPAPTPSVNAREMGRPSILHIVYGAGTALAGLYLLTFATSRSRLGLHQLLATLSRGMQGRQTRVVFQFTGGILVVLGFFWACG